MMPTGSFKDRGMTVMVSYLKSRGIARVLEDSSGNAGASLSAYAAAAGLACRILVPETASYPKIAQIAACGADVVTVKGSRQDVAEAALRQSAEIFYASHNWQPFFVEGMKTLAYELWEQLGFRAPDNLVVPLGYGSNVLGAERGFDELAPPGRDRARAAALRRAGGELRALRGRVRGGRRAPGADRDHAHGGGGDRDGQAHPRGRGAARGAGVGRRRLAVSEAEIVAALRDLARRGLYVEPTSAAAAAGLDPPPRRGRHPPDESTVLVLTGSGLKASAITGELLGLRARSE